jgi:4-amino-4-deoxy-L-arabinose transferase-like glycosyltransferase
MSKTFNLYSVIIIFLAVRVLFILLFLNNDKYYWQDTIHYYSAAESLIENGSFGQDAEKPTYPFGLEPIYSIIISPFVLIGKYAFLGIRLFQSLLFSLSGLLFYKILRFFVNEKLSLIGLVIFLAYPFYIFLSGVILPEGIFVTLLLLFVLLLLKYQKDGRLIDMLFLGVVYVVLIHLKTVTGLLGAFLLFPLFMRFPLSRKLGHVLAVGFVVILISIPWGIRNYNTFEKISLPRSYGGTKESSEITNRYERNFSGKNKFVVIAENIRDYWMPGFTRVDSDNKFNNSFYRTIGVIITLPLLLSLLFILCVKRDKKIYLLLLFIIMYSLPYFILQGQTRYRLPIDFVMMIFLLLLVNNQLYTTTEKTNQIERK